jgi:hypothetical protein
VTNIFYLLFNFTDGRAAALVLLLVAPACLADPCLIDEGVPIGQIDDAKLEEVTHTSFQTEFLVHIRSTVMRLHSGHAEWDMDIKHGFLPKRSLNTGSIEI